MTIDTAPAANASSLPPVTGLTADEMGGAIPSDTATAAPQQKPAQKPKKVAFDHLDFDSMVTAWALSKKLGKSQVHFTLLESGYRLSPEAEEGFDVIYVDMGGGDCDHHGKGLKDSSSLVLAAKKYGFYTDPGMQMLIQLSIDVDNAKRVPWDSVAHLVNGLRFNPSFRDPQSGELDTGRVLEYVFVAFDNYYAQALSRHKSAREYDKHCKPVVLENGLTVLLAPKPKYRGEAFDNRGVDVVMWTSPVNPEKPDDEFMVQIGVNNRKPNCNVDLAPVIATLRKVEMLQRGVKAELSKLDMVGIHQQVPSWYLHDAQDGCHKLIACGTEKHPLKGKEDEATRMSRNHIFGILCAELSKLKQAEAAVE